MRKYGPLRTVGLAYPANEIRKGERRRNEKEKHREKNLEKKVNAMCRRAQQLSVSTLVDTTVKERANNGKFSFSRFSSSSLSLSLSIFLTAFPPAPSRSSFTFRTLFSSSPYNFPVGKNRPVFLRLNE